MTTGARPSWPWSCSVPATRRPGRRSSASPVRAWRTTSARAPSRSSTRCRAVPSARSSSEPCGPRTGRPGTARCDLLGRNKAMTAATGEVVPPRRIAVNGRPIRFRWLQQIIWSFLAANAGALVISALYYLFVQLRWHVGGHTLLYLKPDWDHLFTFGGWTADRHDVRNVYEALLATLFVKSLLANWRKNDRRAQAWYVVISPILIVVVALPVVAAGIWLVNYGLPYVWHAWLGQHHALHNPVHMPHRLGWVGTSLAGFP